MTEVPTFFNERSQAVEAMTRPQAEAFIKGVVDRFFKRQDKVAHISIALADDEAMDGAHNGDLDTLAMMYAEGMAKATGGDAQVIYTLAQTFAGGGEADDGEQYDA
jgi:hypothetical protein